MGVLGLLLGLCAPAAALAQSKPDLATRLPALLEAEGLDGARSALLLYSTVQRRVLFEQNATQPMIVASNVKLATSYAALKLLTANYRWRTPFFGVEEHLGPDGGTRQGLLVQGVADPSLTHEDLAQAALFIKSQGYWRLDGPIYLESVVPGGLEALGKHPRRSGYSAWSAPVGPYIVDENTLELLIAPNLGGVGYELFSRDDFLEAVSALRPGEDGVSAVRVQQDWGEQGAQLTLTGPFPEREAPVPFRVAVGDGRLYFYHRLRQALRQVGIEGEMPLGGSLPETALRRRLYTHVSPALGEILPQSNKHSSNLTADAVLIAMAPSSAEPVSDPVQSGLEEVRRILVRDFPEDRAQIELVDGSGLSRENRLSAAFLVHLLNRVLRRETFRSEFLSSLSVLGQDGTMHFRDLPPRMWSQVRGKTGSLAGTQALSGYLYTADDMVVFSFLINDGERSMLDLQEAQNRVLVGLYDLLVPPGSPSRVPRPPAPKRLMPPPVPSPKPPNPAVDKDAAGAPASAAPVKPPVTGEHSATKPAPPAPPAGR